MLNPKRATTEAPPRLDGIGVRAPRIGRLGLGALMAVFALSVPASAAARTFYVAPNGTGSACIKATPCTYVTASASAGPGDQIYLAGDKGSYGSFQSPLGELSVAGGVTVSGQPGQPMPVYYGGPVSPYPAAAVASGGKLEKIEVIHTNGGIALESSGSGTAVAVVRRVLARSPAAGGYGCIADPSVPYSLSNSVCQGKARGLYASGGTTITLTNDTIIGNGTSSTGAFFVASSGPLVVKGHSTILRGTGDIYANGMFGSITVTLDHSDYAHVFVHNASVTPAGTNHNITAAPQFVNAAKANYREVGTSPTIDRGANAPVCCGGPLDRDLVGNARRLPGHPRCGIPGPRIADIGAYEFVPKPPLCPITFGTPVRDTSAGTAQLPVRVRGPGKLVLSGTNVQTVSKAASQSGTVKMLVTATGAAANELNHTGHATVNVTVHYTPNGAPLGGLASSKGTQVTLVRH